MWSPTAFEKYRGRFPFDRWQLDEFDLLRRENHTRFSRENRFNHAATTEDGSNVSFGIYLRNFSENSVKIRAKVFLETLFRHSTKLVN